MRLVVAFSLMMLAVVPAPAQLPLEGCRQEFIVQTLWRHLRRDLLPAHLGSPPPKAVDEGRIVFGKGGWPTIPLRLFLLGVQPEECSAPACPDGFDKLSPQQRCQLALAVLRSDGQPEPSTEARSLLLALVGHVLAQEIAERQAK